MLRPYIGIHNREALTMVTREPETRTVSREGQFSFVNEHPAADPEAARTHFLARLSVETDPADVQLDLERGPDRIHVVDVRSAEAYDECHVPGAISLPHRSIDAQSTAALGRDRTVVVYCWGPGCNAAQKGAVRLAALGFRVKEMIGGLEYWRREGHAVEGSAGASAPLYG
jgi:rhodanese-related sulfurtransferase